VAHPASALIIFPARRDRPVYIGGSTTSWPEIAMTDSPPPGPPEHGPPQPEYGPPLHYSPPPVDPYQPPAAYPEPGEIPYQPYEAPMGYAAPGQMPYPPPYGYGYPLPRQTEGMAIAALAVSCAGVLGMCTYGIGGILGLVGAILGHVARRRIQRNGTDGAGLALAGIIVGWILTAVSVALLAGVIILIASPN
jgi:hypothetical protein